MKKSIVYYLPEDRWEFVPGLIRKAAGEFFKENEFVAIKVHFGEKGNKGYLRPEWVKSVVTMVKERKANPFLTDTNTIYRGQRADAVHHLMIAHGHGFKLEKLGAPVLIADGLRGNDYVEVEIDGKHFRKVKVAKGIHDAHAMIVISHTKGHLLTGFGGALKNLGMGCASKGAKYEMHSGVSPEVILGNCVGCGECVVWCSAEALTLDQGKVAMNKALCVGCGECILACSSGALEIPWDVPSAQVQEKMVEYACGVVMGKQICYVNSMHHVTKNCDCFPAEHNDLLVDNRGILVSMDPVAIDQASIDLINKAAGKDIFKDVHHKDYNVQLLYAEQLGMGSRKYQIVEG